MIALTDKAVSLKLAEVLGFGGVFAPEEEALRLVLREFKKVEFPVFSIYRPSATKSQTRYNRPMATGGGRGRQSDTGNVASRLKVMPIDVTYDCRAYFSREEDLISAIRDVFLFSASAVGVELSFPELGTDKVAAFTAVDDSLVFEWAEEPEIGRYRSMAFSVSAETWVADKSMLPIIAKLVGSFYDSTFGLTKDVQIGRAHV